MPDRRLPIRGNLPVPLSVFVGRGAECAAVSAALAVNRLVTLTGMGGVGKTRLALRVAADVRSRFPDGVWLVELAELRGGTLLVSAVADAVGMRERTPRAQAGVLAEFLNAKDLLLILDSCDHLLDDCAALVRSLLPSAPGLRILLTSRQPLGLAEERTLPVPPLPVEPRPAPHGDEQPADAVRLFLDRAAHLAPEAVSACHHRLSAVQALCARLEGIPLAIELAAAQLRTLSVEEIDATLRDRFALLADHRRGEPVRHQALRAAIGWSHQLCTPAQRLLWARLSVFSASFSADAVTEVCTDTNLPRTDILAALAGLADKSLLIRETDGDGAVRHRMLDTVREYGATWLRELGEEQPLARRHAAFCLREVRQAEAAWSGPAQLAWHTRISAELPNIRAAVDFLLTHPGPEHHRMALELTSRLWFEWIGCGRLREGRHHLERALRQTPAEPDHDRTRALWVCGWIASVQVDADGATPYLEQAAADAARLGDPEGSAFSLQWLGQVAFLHGDWDQAIALLTRALALHSPQAPLNPGPVPARCALGAAWLARARTHEAQAVLEEARALCTANGEIWMRSHLDWLLAQTDRARGRFSAAIARIRDALWIQHAFHDVIGTAVTLEVLAGLRASLLDAERAARLLGAARALRETYAVAATGAPFLAAIRAQATRTAIEQLGAETYESAFAEGARMDISQAVAYALDAQLTPPPPAPIAHSRPLSTTEARLTRLLAQGLDDQAIAERLDTTHQSVTERIADILATLGLTDRTELSAWATHYGPGGIGDDHPTAPRAT
ncbi:NB-ARC domain-containing protein [Streptomyces sp. NPDC046909]|uniref:ATP-binding protein n=1 Tax=Streptomyces sp. NPDC046909 TaxID=3155617 RepID=UPI0033F396F9